MIWSGKTARDCDTLTMMHIDEEYWDNFHFLSLHIIDWKQRRLVHTIDIPMDEAAGWPPEIAIKKIDTLRKELETLIKKHAYAFAHGTMAWESIQV